MRLHGPLRGVFRLSRCQRHRGGVGDTGVDQVQLKFDRRFESVPALLIINPVAFLVHGVYNLTKQCLEGKVFVQADSGDAARTSFVLRLKLYCFPGSFVHGGRFWGPGFSLVAKNFVMSEKAIANRNFSNVSNLLYSQFITFLEEQTFWGQNSAFEAIWLQGRGRNLNSSSRSVA